MAGELDELVPQVYADLRRIAHGLLRRERPGHTLSPTALAHEAFFRLVGQQRVGIADRAHFLSIAAMSMRRILVDYARARVAAKRGDGALRVTLDTAAGGAVGARELLEVDDAIKRLAELSGRQAEVVVLRYFGGLTDEEAAAVLGVSVPTVRRDWRLARAWLARELGG